ncbi:hypothetical protein I4U23_020438 [Adineta vaga]|nr:hypothetical protein I4U23_020438 [Adineta vaga]
MPTCHVELEHSDYSHLLDTRLNDIVGTFQLNRYLESNEEFRWCKSSKGCVAGQLVSNHKELFGYESTFYTGYCTFFHLYIRHCNKSCEYASLNN